MDKIKLFFEPQSVALGSAVLDWAASRITLDLTV